MFAIRGRYSITLQEVLRYFVYRPVTNIPPIPVAARSKALVCGRSLGGIAGSNRSGGMDVYLL